MNTKEEELKELLLWAPASKINDKLQDAFSFMLNEAEEMKTALRKMMFRAHMHEDDEGFYIAYDALGGDEVDK